MHDCVIVSTSAFRFPCVYFLASILLGREESRLARVVDEGSMYSLFRVVSACYRGIPVVESPKYSLKT